MYMRLRRKFSFATVLLFVLLLVVGMTNAKTTLRVAHWWGGDTFRAAIAEFEKEYPNIEVKEEQRPWGGFHDKMLIETAAGTGPDIYMVSMQSFGTIVKAGSLCPLDEFVKRDGLDLAKFVPSPKNIYSYQGKLYAIQTWMSGGFTALYVNKDLTDAAGIDVPEYGMPGFDTWHWKDFLAALQKTTRIGSGGKFEQWGLSYPWDWVSIQFIWENGGELFDEIVPIDETRIRVDEPAAVEAIQFLVDLVQKYKVVATGVSLVPTPYLSGKVAFSWGWPIYAEAAKASFEWAMIHPPWEKRKITVPSGNVWGISARSEHKDAAWAFIKWITTNARACELIAPRALPTGYGPTVQEFIGRIKDRHEQRAYLTILSRSLPGSGAIARLNSFGTKAPSEVGRIFTSALNAVLSGQKPVAQALRDVATEVNGILAKK